MYLSVPAPDYTDRIFPAVHGVALFGNGHLEICDAVPQITDSIYFYVRTFSSKVLCIRTIKKSTGPFQVLKLVKYSLR